MDWVKWLIPLIALVVWIVVNLLKVPEEPKPPERQPRPPRPPGQDPFANLPREPKSDLDKFIEEAKRRRQQQEQRKAQQRGSPPPVPVGQRKEGAAEPLPRVRPAPPSADRSRPVTPPPPPSRPVPVVPVARPALSDRPRPAQTPRPTEIGRQVPTAESLPAGENRRSADGFTTPPTSQAAYAAIHEGLVADTVAAREVLKMFENPNTARVAFILREILDRPVSARRGRGH